MKKLQRRPKVSRQIRVIRVSRSFVVHPTKRVDSRILSSVDSWLSSAPSIEESKVQETPKTVIIKPSITKTTQRDYVFRRRCIALIAAIIVVILVCSMVGIVLGVKLQSSPTTTIETSTTASY